MRTIFALTLSLFVLASSAQTKEKDNSILVGKVVSDTLTFNALVNKEESVLRSKNVIEIRLITTTMVVSRSYIALIYDKKWKAVSVDFDKAKGVFVSKEIVMKTPIEAVFNQLVNNNVFALPDQSTLQLERASFDPQTNMFTLAGMDISDGVSYTIEFKVGDKYRRYSFINPVDYSKFYPYNNEFKNYVSIVKAFNTLTKK